ncbi:MAG: protein-export chaperone SecB, partial [Rhodospirillales bacterium]
MAKKPPKDDKKTEDPKPEADAPAGIEPTPEQLAAAEKSLEQPLIINAQYTKDLSFEAPSAPGIFAELQEKQPDINLNINVSANPVKDKVVEVIFEAHAECKLGDKVVYILELEYAGVFTLNVPEEHLQPIILIECPRLLFPFARNILADVTRDGGYPPLMLGPLDFAGMYQAK